MRVLVFTFILLISLFLILGENKIESAYCHGQPKAGAHLNQLPFITNEPKFIKQTKNGKRYLISSDDGDNWVHVAHIYGSAYEMGYAQGELFKDELVPFLSAIWTYMKDEIATQLDKFPDWLAKMIAEFGLDIALDFTYEIMSEYIGKYFLEEMQGLSDATGLEYNMIRRIHMIGELTQGKCSMVGAWGKATKGGRTVQLRSFDWIVDGAPFRDQPAIIVYHPNQGNRFANIGFIGWIGSFSGMNDQQMGINEIGVYYPDETFGRESRIGIPFVFLLRDILQFDKSLDDSINRIQYAARTCNLILGVGDGKLGQVRGFEYSHYNAYVFDDKNMRPDNETWHPKIENTVYWGMDWNCPPYSQRLSERIKANYGNIDAEVVARDIAPMTTTGDLQVSIYDLSFNRLYLSVARRSQETKGDPYAYDRPFFQVNMTKLFDEKL